MVQHLYCLLTQLHIIGIRIPTMPLEVARAATRKTHGSTTHLAIAHAPTACRPLIRVRVGL